MKILKSVLFHSVWVDEMASWRKDFAPKKLEYVEKKSMKVDFLIWFGFEISLASNKRKCPIV